MLLTTLALGPLFWTLSLATITLEELPSELKAGSEYYIKWTQDRDYRLSNLDLTHSEDAGEWFSHVRVVDHMLDFPIGKHEIHWKVPAVKDNGNYRLWIRGMPVGPPEKDEWLPGTPAYAYSNTFRIVGGPTLYKREIAIVMAGTLGVMALVIGTVVVGVKVWRRRTGEGAVAL